MSRQLVCQNLIIRLAALALFVLCFGHQLTGAQEPESQPSTGRTAADEFIAFFHTNSWGMTRGQTTRIKVINPSEISERRIIFVQVKLFDTDGNVIAESAEIAIAPGEFRSVDFSRDAIALVGEPGSGRLQMRAQVRYRAFFLVDRSILRGLPLSLELIDSASGNTQAVWLTTGFFEVV